MRRIVYGQDHKFQYWAEDVIGLEFRNDATTIGLEDESGDILAATVFDGFSQCDCNMHIASDGKKKWLSREFIVHSFAFPFVQLNLRRVTGLVPANNLQALRFDLKLGFEVEGRLHDALPDQDIILLGMRRAVGLAVIQKYGKGVTQHGR